MGYRRSCECSACARAWCSPSGFSSAQEAIPAPVQAVRQAGPLDVRLRTDVGPRHPLRLDTQYSTQDLGKRLTPEQMEKLATIRAEAPSKFQILTCTLPAPDRRVSAAGGGRDPAATTAPADDAVQRLVWEIGASYMTQPESPEMTENQRRARADFVQASLKTLPPQPEPMRHLLEQAARYGDPDFNSPEKAGAFLVLKDWYSPYRQVGDVDPGRYLANRRAHRDRPPCGRCRRGPGGYRKLCGRAVPRYTAALGRWRLAQITGNAYAGSIRRFLNDPRLAEFTPQEVSRAYQRVFGRDLQTDLEADREAARLGHPVTYNELRVAARKE